MGIWSLRRAGEVGIALSIIICLMGAAATAVEAVPVRDPISEFLTTYGMPGGVVGLLGWFLRHVTSTIDRRMGELLDTLKTISKEHHDGLEKLINRNAELEDRIFTTVVKDRDQKAAEGSRPIKLKQ